MKITVLGSGSWGTALGHIFALNGHDTVLWARRQAVADEIQFEHRNSQYLSDARLPSALGATTSLQEALVGADIVVYAVASAGMPDMIRHSHPYVPSHAVLAHAVKGFEVSSKQRMSELLLSAFPGSTSRLCVISGPSHAEEVVALLPTTIVAAAYTRSTAERLQDALMNQSLRVYTNPDVVGTELGGTLKNIIALGVGMADGLGFGDNAKAALMTRGLAEITRLGIRMGASALTFAGLSGIGDLIVTCTSKHSRNFRAGRLLGDGVSLDETLASIGMVVEGVRTTQAVAQLAADYHIQMPITQAIFDVLFAHKNPRDAVEDLMGRERGHEIEEVAREHISPQWLES